MKKLLTLIVLLLITISGSAEDVLAGLTQRQLQKETGDIKLVATNNQQSVLISGRTGEKKGTNNLYMSGSIMLPKPISLEGKTLKIMVASENCASGFYVRAYNRNESKPAWSFFSWNSVLKRTPQEITLTAGRDRLLKWEPAVVNGEAAGQIDRLQFFIGTDAGNTPIDVTISSIQVIPQLSEKEDKATLTANVVQFTNNLDQVVALPSKSILVNDGKANLVILHPDSAAGKSAAGQIVEVIKSITGVTVPAQVGYANNWNPATHAIMLGNIYDNDALRVLYARRMTMVDEFLPGCGGYTLESVIEPFRPGCDIIVLGASGDESLQLAAAAFINKVKQFGQKEKLELPIIFETKYTAKIIQPQFEKNYIEKGIAEANTRLKEGIHMSLGGQLAAIGNRYRLTRNPLDAKLYVAVAKIYLSSAMADPRKFGGPWGFDSDFASYDAISGWDLIEHDPALSTEDRLLVSNMILRWLNDAIAAESIGGCDVKGPASNHLTFASLGTLMGAFYYLKYYQESVIQSKDWLAVARKVFSNQINYAKVRDDCDGYQWLTWQHVMMYSLALPDSRIVENGVGDKVMLACGVTMDNLGIQAPYGDDNSWASSGSEFIVLNLYYALSRSNLAAIMIEKKRPRFSAQPGTFYAKLSSRPETVLDGVKIIDLDKGFYDYTEAEGVVPPLNRTFDKFSFRQNLNADSLYLLVDGVNIGGHRHADANSVLRYSQFGREWLAENGYTLNQQKYHNSMLILFNGEAFNLPGLMELVNHGENEVFGYVTVRAPQCGPTDWIRYYVWLKKNQAWLVIDELDARKPGKYRLTQRWNGVGEIAAQGDGYVLEQKGAKIRFQTTPDANLSVCDDTTNLAESWIGYPYAASAIHVMDQIIESELKADSRSQMIAVWHGAGDKAEIAPWAIDRVKNGFSVDTGSELYTITADNPGELKFARKESITTLAERKPLANKIQSSAIPALKEVWRGKQYQVDNCVFTNSDVAKVIKFNLSGTEPAASNILGMPANKLAAICDGSWSKSGDSVKYAENQVVTIDFNFEHAQFFNRMAFHLWWATNSSNNTGYKLKTAEVIFSDDNFIKDIRKMPVIDAGSETHSNWSTVEFSWNFEPQRARQVRLILTPQLQTAIYLGEVIISGKPEITKDQVLTTELTKVIRVKDAKDDYLAVSASDGSLIIYSPDGKELSRVKFPARINDIATLDVDKDGEMELLLACQDAYLRAVKRNGKEVWKVKFEKYRAYPDVTIVKTSDINNDGEEEILVGCDNWRIYVLDRNGKEIWKYEVIRPVRAVETADIDGDGKTEILCGSSYMRATVLNNTGIKRWGGVFGVGCRAIAAPLNGQGKQRNVIIGTGDGKVTFHDFNGGVLNSFNAGDEIFMMAAAKAINGREDVFVCSYNGYVYRFNADGRLIWNVAAPSSVVVVKALNDGGAVAGTIDGYVCVISKEGEIKEESRLNGEIADILVDGDQLRVVTRKGDIATLLKR